MKNGNAILKQNCFFAILIQYFWATYIGKNEIQTGEDAYEANRI